MRWFASIALAFAMVLLPAGYTDAQQFNASLNGFAVVPVPVLTPATGTLTLNLDMASSSITYNLSYSHLISPPTFAAIHFAKPNPFPDLIIAFLCDNSHNPLAPPGTPTCPPAPASIAGTLTGANVVGIPSQNIAAGDFSALAAVLASDTAEADVHSIKLSRGEIGGQIQSQGQQ
jgi:hypothetical protein